MKILFLLNSFNVGGYEQLMLDVFRHLHGRGHSITMCCLKGAGKLAPELESIGVPVLSGFFKSKVDIGAPARIKAALSGSEFDLVFLEMGRNALVIGEYLKKSLGNPVMISSIHGTGVQELGSYFKRGQRTLLNRLDGIIACANTQGRYLEEVEGIDASLLRVIVNGVDHSVFCPPDFDGVLGEYGEIRRKSIATVASLTPEKGHAAFIEAAEIALREVPDAAFYIIGTGPEAERIDEMIRSRELEGSVIPLGLRRDLPTLLPMFRAVALASIPMRETLPISTMEAMSCGVPTVNTAVGSVADLVDDGNTGFIVPPGDVPALAAAFVKLLTDESLARSMGEKARARVEELFTMDRALAEYESYFQEMVDRN